MIKKHINKGFAGILLTALLIAPSTNVFADDAMIINENELIDGCVLSGDFDNEDCLDPYEEYEPGEEIASGSCGDTAQYKIIKNVDGTRGLTLQITGSGTIQNYTRSSDPMNFRVTNAPWGSYRAAVVKLEISDAITSIGNCAFAGMNVIWGDFPIPSGVTKIGKEAFADCGGLVRNGLNLPEGLTEIGEGAFAGSGIKRLTLPSTLTSMGDRAFSSCTSMEGDLTIPSGLKYISKGAFAGCSAAGTLTIPSSVELGIADEAFSGSRFTKLVIYESAGRYYNKAFYGMTGLKEVVIGALPSSPWNEYNTSYTNSESYGANMSPWYMNRGNIESITVLDGISTIPKDAFRECGNEECVINIPASVTTIDDRAFYEYKGDIDGIPEGVTSIGDYAYYGCEGIDGTLTISSAVTHIGANAFDACSNINKVDNKSGESVTLPRCADGLFWVNDTRREEGAITEIVNAVAILTDGVCTVTYNANGGVCGISEMNTGVDGKLDSLPIPTRVGYTFDGWFLDDTKLTVDTDIYYDCTVVAKWTKLEDAPEEPGPQDPNSPVPPTPEEPEEDPDDDFDLDDDDDDSDEDDIYEYDPVVLVKGGAVQIEDFDEAEIISYSVNGIASINKKDGTVKGLKNGKTTATIITSEEDIYQIDITVVAPAFKKSKLYPNKGDSISVGFNAKGADGKVTYKSSNTKVVTVDKKGKLKAKSTGKAKITATIQGVKYTCDVTVYNPTISGKSSVKAGKTITLKIKNGKGKTTWTTSKKAIATIDKNGKVTGKKKGTVTITAKNNGKVIKKKITVK